MFRNNTKNRLHDRKQRTCRVRSLSGESLDARLLMAGDVVQDPSLHGDFNSNGRLDGGDVDMLSAHVGKNPTDPAFDLNGDQIVDQKDRRVWVEEIRRTYFGDASLDGRFNSGDLVTVFQSGEYEDQVSSNSSWSEGDFDGNGEFNSGDFILAFQSGGYELGQRIRVDCTVRTRDDNIIVEGTDGDDVIKIRTLENAMLQIECGSFVQEIDGTGVDQIRVSGRYGNDELDASQVKNVVVEISGGAGCDTLVGGDGDDVLSGDEGNDKLFGGDGSDSLFGNEGNDELFGDLGHDTLEPGPGNDLLDGVLDGAENEVAILNDSLLEVEPIIVAGDSNGFPTDSPSNRVDANTTTSRFSGVGILLTKGQMACTATPIGQQFILTAAHCLDDNGDGTSDFNAKEVTFQLNFGSNASHEITAKKLHIHPDYTGFLNPSVNDDLAVIQLSAPIPPGVPVYEINKLPYTTTTAFESVGYGRSGDGLNGFTISANSVVKRVGMNTADIGHRDDEGSSSVEVFMFDFDGPSANLNLWGGTTLGNHVETTFGYGDSGGPSFIYNSKGKLQLFGVNTFIGRGLASAPFFGSKAGGMVVSTYASWIESLTDNNPWTTPWVNAGSRSVDWWNIRHDDKYVAGDFIPGTGQDELVAINPNGFAHLMKFESNWDTTWANVGSGSIDWWNIGANDKYVSGDFVPGNNRDELIAINPNGYAHLMEFDVATWNTQWTNFGIGNIDWWNIGAADKFVAGDFIAGNDRDELLAVNPNGLAHLMEFRGNTWITSWTNVGNGSIDWWNIASTDKFLAGDFIAGNNRDELQAINPNGFAHTMAFDNGSWRTSWANVGSGNIDWWLIGSNDNYVTGDLLPGNNRDELLAVNPNGFAHVMVFDSNNWKTDWANIGTGIIDWWHIGSSDQMIAGDFIIDSGDELMAINPNGFAHLMQYELDARSVDSIASNGTGGPTFGVRRNGQLFVVGDDNGTHTTQDILPGNTDTSELIHGSLVATPANESVFGVATNGDVILALRDRVTNTWNVDRIHISGGAAPGSLVTTGVTNPLYGVKNDGQLFLLWNNNGKLQQSDILPGNADTSNLMYDSLVVEPGRFGQSVFGVANDGHIIHAVWNQGGFNVERIPIVGGASANSLVATGVTNPLYGVKYDGQLFLLWNNNGKLQQSDILPGNADTSNLMYDSLVVEPGRFGQSVFGVANDGHIIHAVWKQGGFDVERIAVAGGALPNSLMANRATNPLYGVRNNGQLFVIWKANDGTLHSGDILNPLTKNLRGTHLALDGGEFVFGIDQSGNLIHSIWTPGGWQSSLVV